MGVTTMEPVEQAEVEEPAATTTASKMFKYSVYLDVGDGARQCEHARSGQCTDNEHFHAWCRLPNPFQHEDIRKKGLAAKARKIRELRDPESDAAVILEAEISALSDEAFRGQIIDEMLSNDWAGDYLDAQRKTDEDERFVHMAQDREEFTRLDAAERDTPEAERSEEYKQLAAHIELYLETLRKNLDAAQGPKRAELESRSIDALVEMVRNRRIADHSDRTFVDTYTPWMWFVGTFKVELHPSTGRPHLPMWDDIGVKDRPAAGTMFGEAPEVIEALKRTFNDLQIALQRGSQGNS